jgi:hypothetical protein
LRPEGDVRVWQWLMCVTVITPAERIARNRTCESDVGLDCQPAAARRDIPNYLEAVADEYCCYRLRAFVGRKPAAVARRKN